MAWSTIRKATNEDYLALNKAARRFIDRHGIDIPGRSDSNTDGWFTTLDIHIHVELEMHSDPNDYDHRDAKKMELLWKRCIRRALHEPNSDGIAYGYVGYNAQ